MVWKNGCPSCAGDLRLAWEERWSYVICDECGMVNVDQDKLALIAIRPGSSAGRKAA